MSGHAGKPFTLDNDDGLSLENLKQTFFQMHNEGIDAVINVWDELYGKTSEYDDRCVKLNEDVKSFWEHQVSIQNDRKQNLSKSIQQAGMDALRLEKVLGLEPKVQHLACDKDVPLVVIEENIWKILNSYQEISEQRLREYSELQKKEEELCTILSLTAQIKDKCFGIRKGCSKRKLSYIPTSDQMISFRKRISELETQKEKLEYEFENEKEKLQCLLEQCEITPNKSVKRYFGREGDEFPVTSESLKLLTSSVEYYQTIQTEMVTEANNLRKDIETLGKKIQLDMNCLETFIKENSGFTKNTIDNLKEKLSNLKDERKKKLKDLIVIHRKILNELWDKCCYTKEERDQFKPYHTKHWSEEVLNFHELEIERLEFFYEENKRVFQLAEKYDELWGRLLQLEESASNKDRLFNNRGGCLLKEEKERKLLQKKVPAIKKELMDLLKKHKEGTGKDFMYYGIPLQTKIEQKEEEREISKENEKFMRKIMNEENLFLESRLGVKSTVGNKRRMLTPQHPNNHSKVLKAAHSTPRMSRSASTLSGRSVVVSAWPRAAKEGDNANLFNPKSVRKIKYDTLRPKGSPVHSSTSYESFQEHITKSISKQSHEKCLHRAHSRVLRPRDENKPTFLSENKRLVCDTPVTKLALRSATSSKIPRPTTPIDAKYTAKGRGSRRRLPIIF